jgi:hypothetical protein
MQKFSEYIQEGFLDKIKNVFKDKTPEEKEVIFLDSIKKNKEGNFVYWLSNEDYKKYVENKNFKLEHSYSPVGNLFVSKFNYKEIFKKTGLVVKSFGIKE